MPEHSHVWCGKAQNKAQCIMPHYIDHTHRQFVSLASFSQLLAEWMPWNKQHTAYI